MSKLLLLRVGLWLLWPSIYISIENAFDWVYLIEYMYFLLMGGF